MKKKTLCLCLIGLLAAAGLLTGCTRTSEELILSKENSATEEEIKTSLPENKDLDEVPLDEEETEREAAPVPEDGKAVSRSAYSVTLTDTVKYVESSRKEITRTEKRLSVVDENDPSTYQIVRKEEAVEVQNGDTPQILQRRVMEQAEWKILPRAIDLIANGKVKVEGHHVTIES